MQETSTSTNKTTEVLLNKLQIKVRMSFVEYDTNNIPYRGGQYRLDHVLVTPGTIECVR